MTTANTAIKICIVGDAESGKTLYLNQRTSAVPLEEQPYAPTVGADVFQIEIGRKKLNVWDTAGNARLAVFSEGYWIGSDGIILVSATPNLWIERIRNVPGLSDIPVVLFEPGNIPKDAIEQAVSEIAKSRRRVSRRKAAAQR